MLKLREVFHVFIWHTFTSGKQTVDRNWQQNNAATYLDNFSLYTSWRCTSAVQRLGWNHPTLLDFQLNIFRKLTMVLHVPDIDNPGERDAVETLLAMRNSSRINHRDNASNSSEEDRLYSPYLRASPVRGPRFYRGDEASSSYPDYPKMRRPSKLARVGIRAAMFIIWNISLPKIRFCIYKGCVIICNLFYINILESPYCNRSWNFSESFVCIFIALTWRPWRLWPGDAET